MVKVGDTIVRYKGSYYTCKVDYMQKEHKFRLSLPDSLSKLFDKQYVYGSTEYDANCEAEKLLKAFFESNETPAEKIISYVFEANIYITNPLNDYVIITINEARFGVTPAVEFNYSIGYRQIIPDPDKPSERKTIYFTYDSDDGDRRDWSPYNRIIPWSQEVEDFFVGFKNTLTNVILNMYTFLDQPYQKLRESIHSIGAHNMLPFLNDIQELPFFPANSHSICTKCGEMKMIYENAKGEREIRCSRCGTIEPTEPDKDVVQRLVGTQITKSLEQ